MDESGADFVAGRAVPSTVTRAPPLAAREAEVAAAAVHVATGIGELWTALGDCGDAVQLSVSTQRQLEGLGRASVPVHHVDEWDAPVSPVDASRGQGQSERVLGGRVDGAAAEAVEVDALDGPPTGVRPAQVVVLQVQREHVGCLQATAFHQNQPPRAVHVARLDARRVPVPVSPVQTPAMV